MCRLMFELALAFQLLKSSRWQGTLVFLPILTFQIETENKKASIQITNARWAQALKNALSFSQSSNLETVEQIQVTILF